MADNIVSSLGFTTQEQFTALSNLQSGIKQIDEGVLSPDPFFGAQINSREIATHFDHQDDEKYTRLEKMFIIAIINVLKTVPDINKNRLLLIISTTKGNIDLFNSKNTIPRERIGLSAMTKVISRFLKLKHNPLIISNACISGVSAILTAKNLISMGMYDHVIVAGGDILSEFVVSGFQSLKALSDRPCRPYDADRDGITLGEACAAILLSNDATLCTNNACSSSILGGGQSNDAHHISGPSRTARGLKIAIAKALSSSGIKKEAIGYINAHGTGTLYNDEMESIAFNDLQLQSVPINSLKGYLGHTLGASGVIETILSIWQLNNRLLFKSFGYEKSGVSRALNLLNEHYQPDNLRYIMKTASGFGGCNAALIIGKNEA